MIIPWAKTAGAEFTSRAGEICRDLGWPIDYLPWLMACIAFESADSFAANVVNRAGSGAVGLIQFMPATARDLGTSTEALAATGAIAQLDYVERYFRPYAPRIRSLADMYMSILLPKYVGAEGDAVLFSDGVAYRQNSGLDANADGRVTKDEAADKVRERLARGYLPASAGEVDV